MSLRIQNNIEAFNAHRQLDRHGLGALQVDGEALQRLSHQPRRRRLGRPGDQREAARRDRRPRPGPAQRPGRRLARADRRRRDERGSLDAPARPRAGRPVQQRHALRVRQGGDHRRGLPALRRDQPDRFGHQVQRHRPAHRLEQHHVPGRRGRRADDLGLGRRALRLGLDVQGRLGDLQLRARTVTSPRSTPPSRASAMRGRPSARCRTGSSTRSTTWPPSRRT